MRFLVATIVVLVIVSCSSTNKMKVAGLPAYTPESKLLHDTIARLDSIFFEAYNNCRLDIMENLLSDSLEFYHDRGGLSTSKSSILQAIKANICFKVKRELLLGSMEVYPIPNFGAVQMSVHRFHNNQEKSISRFSKVVQTWHRENGHWKLYRVISLH